MYDCFQDCLFPELHQEHTVKITNRNDVMTGECGVNLTLSVLQEWNIKAFTADDGSEYDIIVDYNNIMLKLQVKSKRSTANNITYKFTRGYHGSKTGVYDYKQTDFDISACVNISTRRVLFNYGVQRYVYWKKHQFLQTDAEYLSWQNAVSKFIQKKTSQNV